MSNSTLFNTVSGLVGAGAYGHAVAPMAQSIPVPAQAIKNILQARVDLYCDRQSQALADIRHARAQLRASHATVPPATYQALDEASWLARHDDYLAAERSLDSVLDLILAANAGRR